MNTPRDPFSDSFDSIEIDPATAPSAEAIDRAIAYFGLHEGARAADADARGLQAPGFYLLDDAQGRFTIDCDTGVVSLRDESVLSHEHGQIHTARLRAVEPSGNTYTIDLALRLTGRVPQMVGSEDLLESFSDAPPPLESQAGDEEYEYEYEERDWATRDLRYMPWVAYNASRGHAKPLLGSEHAPFGTLIESYLANFDVGFAGLTIVDYIPSPNGRTALWSL